MLESALDLFLRLPRLSQHHPHHLHPKPSQVHHQAVWLLLLSCSLLSHPGWGQGAGFSMAFLMPVAVRSLKTLQHKDPIQQGSLLWQYPQKNLEGCLVRSMLLSKKKIRRQKRDSKEFYPTSDPPLLPLFWVNSITYSFFQDNLHLRSWWCSLSHWLFCFPGPSIFFPFLFLCWNLQPRNKAGVPKPCSRQRVPRQRARPNLCGRIKVNMGEGFGDKVQIRRSKK